MLTMCLVPPVLFIPRHSIIASPMFATLCAALALRAVRCALYRPTPRNQTQETAFLFAVMSGTVLKRTLRVPVEEFHEMFAELVQSQAYRARNSLCYVLSPYAPLCYVLSPYAPPTPSPISLCPSYAMSSSDVGVSCYAPAMPSPISLCPSYAMSGADIGVSCYEFATLCPVLTSAYRPMLLLRHVRH
eukprot:2225305-Rhodomonas_salina.1